MLSERTTALARELQNRNANVSSACQVLTREERLTCHYRPRKPLLDSGLSELWSKS